MMNPLANIKRSVGEAAEWLINIETNAKEAIKQQALLEDNEQTLKILLSEGLVILDNMLIAGDLKDREDVREYLKRAQVFIKE